MEASDSMTARIIEPPSPARAALHQILTTMGLTDILVFADYEPAFLTEPVCSCQLIFIGSKAWEQGKPSMIQAFQQHAEPHSTKVLLFLSHDDQLDLLEAIHAGIDGYFTYPFSIHNIRQKLHSLLPDYRLPDQQSTKPKTRRRSRPQKSPQSAHTD